MAAYKDAQWFGQLRTVKSGAKYLGLLADDEAYRGYLEAVTGKRSCSQMSLAELRRVVAKMHMDGFPRASAPAQASRKPSPTDPGRDARQAKLIRALWLQMADNGIVNDRSETAIDSYCHRICKVKLAYLTTKQAQAVIETLKKWWERAAGPEAANQLNAILAGRVSVEILPSGQLVVGGSHVRQ